MAPQTRENVRWWIGLLGPVITVLALGGTMAVGFGAQSQTISDLKEKVDKLYDVLIYPRVSRH